YPTLPLRQRRSLRLIRYRPQSLPDLNASPVAGWAHDLGCCAEKSGKAGKRHRQRSKGPLRTERIVGKRLKSGENRRRVVKGTSVGLSNASQKRPRVAATLLRSIAKAFGVPAHD